MKTRLSNWTRIALPVLLVGALACGDDDEATGVTTADLAGAWEASSFVIANDNGFVPGSPLDLVGTLGVTVSMNVQASGAFTFTTDGLNAGTGGALDDLSLTGTVTVTGNNTVQVEASTDPGNPSDATFTLSGDNLTLNLPDAALIDFDDSGDITAAEEVDITASMSR